MKIRWLASGVGLGGVGAMTVLAIYLGSKNAELNSFEQLWLSITGSVISSFLGAMIAICGAVWIEDWKRKHETVSILKQEEFDYQRLYSTIYRLEDSLRFVNRWDAFFDAEGGVPLKVVWSSLSDLRENIERVRSIIERGRIDNEVVQAKYSLFIEAVDIANLSNWYEKFPGEPESILPFGNSTNELMHRAGRALHLLYDVQNEVENHPERLPPFSGHYSPPPP